MPTVHRSVGLVQHSGQSELDAELPRINVSPILRYPFDLRYGQVQVVQLEAVDPDGRKRDDVPIPAEEG